MSSLGRVHLVPQQRYAAAAAQALRLSARAGAAARRVFLTARRKALHGRVRALLHRFSDVCIAAWRGRLLHAAAGGPRLALGAHLGRSALWRAINIDLLTLVSSILLLDNGPLSSAAALNAALLERPENGLAALLLAEDATTAARRAGLKRARGRGSAHRHRRHRGPARAAVPAAGR